MSAKHEKAKEKEFSPLPAGGVGSSSATSDACAGTDIIINVSPSSKAATIVSAAEDDDVPHEKLLGAPQATCRICMEGQTKKEDPLISPCLCKGSTRYIHRACLAQWRATKVGTKAHYRCEICHFEYLYRRIWWARLLRAKPVAFTIFIMSLVLVAALVGFVRYPWSVPAAHGAGANFVLNVIAGLGVLGIVGLFGFVYAVCTGRWHRDPSHDPHHTPWCYADCCCACPMDGEGAIVCVVFVLIYTGLAYLCYALFGVFFNFVHSRLEHASYMVENIVEDGKDAGGWRDWLFGSPVKAPSPSASSDSGGGGGGGGSGGSGGVGGGGHGGGQGGGGGGRAGGSTAGAGKGASDAADGDSGVKKWGPAEADCTKAPGKESMV